MNKLFQKTTFYHGFHQIKAEKSGRAGLNIRMQISLTTEIWLYAFKMHEKKNNVKY